MVELFQTLEIEQMTDAVFVAFAKPDQHHAAGQYAFLFANFQQLFSFFQTIALFSFSKYLFVETFQGAGDTIRRQYKYR